MDEIKMLLGVLKKDISNKEKQYNNLKIKDREKDKAKELSAEIDKLKNIVSIYEKWIAEIEALTINTPEEQKKLDETLELMAAPLKYYNDHKFFNRKNKYINISDTLENAVNNSIKDIAPKNGDKEKEAEPELKHSENAYQSIIDDRTKEIKEKIERLKKLEKYDKTDSTAKAIIAYNVELEKLVEQRKAYTNPERLLDAEGKAKIAALDVKHEANMKTKAELEAHKAELEEMKKSMTGHRNKKKVDRNIKRVENAMKRLKAADVRLLEEQKGIMYPKYKVELKKQRMLSKVQGKINYYEEKKRINDSSKKLLSQGGIGLFDGLRSSIYERREKRYLKKIERANEIYNAMKDKNTVTEMRDAKRMVMNKAKVNNVKAASSIHAPAKAAPAPAK